MKEVNEPTTDYRTFFTLGIIFTGAGIAMGFYPMMVLGLLFIGFGLFNRDKWPKNGE